MLRQMSSRQLSEWIAYYQLEPFGGELIDIHFARLQAQWASTKKDVKDPQNFRLWKKMQSFDPQNFYNQLKTALFFKKRK